MNTKFSIAIHILILISESSNPMNSDQMAGSAGTNASYIRKILALLKRAGIVDSRRGIGGYSLALPPEQLTLLQIYQAVTEETNVLLLQIHSHLCHFLACKAKYITVLPRKHAAHLEVVQAAENALLCHSQHAGQHRKLQGIIALQHLAVKLPHEAYHVLIIAVFPGMLYRCIIFVNQDYRPDAIVPVQHISQVAQAHGQIIISTMLPAAAQPSQLMAPKARPCRTQ